MTLIADPLPGYELRLRVHRLPHRGGYRIDVDRGHGWQPVGVGAFAALTDDVEAAIAATVLNGADRIPFTEPEPF